MWLELALASGLLVCLLICVGILHRDIAYQNLLELIKKSMQCMEDIYEHDCGVEKFESVMNICTEWIASHHMRITEDQLRVMIQGMFVELDGRTLNKQ